jgi:AcrR family transcriptional regulator
VSRDADTPRARLLRAARVVVARDGLEGLTLRAIAREAGVSHGAPLRHFPGLGSLLAALSAEGFEQLMASVDAAIADGSSARDRLGRAAAGYLNFAVAEPGVYAVMFRRELADVTDPDYRAAGQASFGQLVSLAAAAQAEGWHADVSPDQLAALLWSHVHGLAELWLHGALQSVLGDVSVDDVVDLYVGRLDL